MYKSLRRLVLVCISGIIILAIAALLVSYMYKDTIASRLLLGINNEQQGELKFEDLSIRPLLNFPYVTLKLSNAAFYESKDKAQNNVLTPILEANNVFLSVDLPDLLKNRINIAAVKLEDASIRLIRYQDSSLNIMRALIPYDTNIVEEESSVDTTALNYRIRDIVFKNIGIIYDDLVENDSSQILIKKLDADISSLEHSIDANIITSIEIVSYQAAKGIHIENEQLILVSVIAYDETKKLLHIDTGDIQLGQFNFDISGEAEFSEQLSLNIAFDGSDDDADLFNYFLTELGIQNLKSGDITFKGTAKGDFNESIPDVRLDFGLKDIELDIPESSGSINNLNLLGRFSSGTQKNLSAASLNIDTIHANLPGGFIRGKAELKNLNEPVVNVDWNMKLDLSGLDDVFRIDDIEELSGTIEIIDLASNSILSKDSGLIEEASNTDIILSGISFNIPDVSYITDLNANIHLDKDTAFIHELSLDAGNTDLDISGKLRNIFNIFSDASHDIEADLNIKSSVFDFPDFFKAIPDVGESFPFLIRDFDLDVTALTTSEKMNEFECNPEIDFVIHKLSSSVDELLPFFTINSGKMKLLEQGARTALDFKDLYIDIANGTARANLFYHSPPVEPDSLMCTAVLNSIRPGKILYPDNPDSIPEYLQGTMNTSLDFHLELSNDSVDFAEIMFDIAGMDFKSQRDTFEFQDLYFKAINTSYDTGADVSILKSITTTLEIKAGEIKSNHFILENIAYDINAYKGTINIIPGNNHIFGTSSSGLYTAMPFLHPPKYDIEFHALEFEVEEVLSSLLIDSLLMGNMNFDVSIESKGYDQKQLLSGINGKMQFGGDSLTMYGVDVDKLIEKFKRSQKFNLADLGAVAFLGPAGLAISKGSDYMRLALGNPGEETLIYELISIWRIENGRLIAEDLAFSTELNRVAATGWIDIAKDSLELSIAVVDKNGCSLISQTIYGKIDDPRHTEMKVIKTVIAPVSNLLGAKKRCKPFYTGSIQHPESKKSNKANDKI